MGRQPAITKCLVCLKSISRQRWGRHFEEKKIAKQIASAQLPPSWEGWHRIWAAFKLLCARSEHRSSVRLLASIRSGTRQETACQHGQLCLLAAPVCSHTQLRGAQGLPGLRGKNETGIFYSSLWCDSLAIHCKLIASSPIAFLTLPSQPTAEDAEQMHSHFLFVFGNIPVTASLSQENHTVCPPPTVSRRSVPVEKIK